MVEPAAKIERAGGLAGTLVLKPKTVLPGEKVGVAVRNRGSKEMFYGLGQRLARRTTEGWKDITLEVLSRSSGARAIRVSAPPGRQVGPRYGSLRDVISLRADAPPGTYQVKKRVESASGRKLTLTAQLLVR
jgi:hypothetical protein